MRIPSFVVALLLASLPASAPAEKIGLQSVKPTGERIGVQKEAETTEKLGLQSSVTTSLRLGLQTRERSIQEEVAASLWDLAVSFAPDQSVVSSFDYKRLRAVAALLIENPNTFVYVQGVAQKGESDPLGVDVGELRALIVISYLELFGVDPRGMELVLPGTAAVERMEQQAAVHRTRQAAAAKESGEPVPPPVLRGVRFGVVEQH